MFQILFSFREFTNAIMQNNKFKKSRQYEKKNNHSYWFMHFRANDMGSSSREPKNPGQD